MSEKNKKSFCVVCIANYCRSPVLEYLLKEKYKKKYDFFSVGLSPIQKPNMDNRSIEFLEGLGYENILHTPKKINNKVLEHFDYFLAIDFLVLNQLNIQYGKYKDKFKLATSQFSKITINDPYRLGNEDYLDIMKKIYHVSANIDLDLY